MKYWNMKLKVHKVWDLRDDFNSGRYMESDYYAKYFADLYINHQKYKRCMAMAKWCMTEYIQSKCLDFTNTEQWYWRRWHIRWRDLAKHYKELTKDLGK